MISFEQVHIALFPKILGRHNFDFTFGFSLLVSMCTIFFLLSSSAALRTLPHLLNSFVRTYLPNKMSPDPEDLELAVVTHLAPSALAEAGKDINSGIDEARLCHGGPPGRVLRLVCVFSPSHARDCMNASTHFQPYAYG